LKLLVPDSQSGWSGFEIARAGFTIRLERV